MNRAVSVVLFVAAALGRSAGAETSVYVASGRDAGLFDQYDIDGFSLEALPAAPGLRIIVRADAETSPSRARFQAAAAPSGAPAPSAERDALARSLVNGAELERQAVDRILDWISSAIRYDPDQRRPQDPASVFRTRRATCVGYAELAVDLLRRVGIVAATVQGILVGDPGTPGYSPLLSGAYHRWVRVFYADRGWRFADPMIGAGEVGSRYVPFSRRAWSRPRDLRLRVISEEEP
jgi:transglutaminase-like putative cysteine protease